MIQSRVKAGLARARAGGKRLGRPKIEEGVEDAIHAALASGTGIRKVAAALGVGVGTVQRIKRIPAACGEEPLLIAGQKPAKT